MGRLYITSIIILLVLVVLKIKTSNLVLLVSKSILPLRSKPFLVCFTEEIMFFFHRAFFPAASHKLQEPVKALKASALFVLKNHHPFSAFCAIIRQCVFLCLI